MTIPLCPKCTPPQSLSGFRSSVVRDGRYYRKSDRKWVRKFRCLNCLTYFSNATHSPKYLQRKRQINEPLRRLLVSGVSQRRAARILNVSRTTIMRKLCFLGAQAEIELRESNRQMPRSKIIEFDDLETFEHTKCKPLSVTLAVESKTRRILGFAVSQMPAKGKLARIAYKKYGPRKDRRHEGRDLLFYELTSLVDERAVIKSDENPHYPSTVKKYFPRAQHLGFKGQRGSITGQGELKKIRFDPLFSLNHTCAMYRANVNRLFRKTWCTTKKPERLHAHLAIYSQFHNSQLIQQKQSGPV